MTLRCNELLACLAGLVMVSAVSAQNPASPQSAETVAAPDLFVVPVSTLPTIEEKALRKALHREATNG